MVAHPFLGGMVIALHLVAHPFLSGVTLSLSKGSRECLVDGSMQLWVSSGGFDKLSLT